MTIAVPASVAGRRDGERRPLIPARGLPAGIRAWLGPLLILAATAAAYVNSFLGLFQFDDFNVIVNNPAVHAWPERLSDLRGIRPLLKLTYILNWTAGPAEFGFHVFNLAVHMANALLVFALGCRLGGRFLETGAARRAALTGALLFALHPVHTEAVTYISGRSSSLMTFFYLASLLAYVRGREHSSRLWLYGISPLLFLCAVMTKEVALTLPAALVLWELCTERPGGLTREALRSQRVHWIALLAAAVAVAANPYYRDLIIFAPTLENFLTQVHGVSYLLGRWVPIDGLSIDPDLPLQSAWTVMLAARAAGLLTLLGAGIWALGRRPWLGFGILWLFLQLLPTNTLVVRWDVANERQLYLAGVGLFMAAGIELERLKAWMPRGLVTGAVIAVCAILAVATFLRNHDYGSHIRLWEDAARKAPRKARVHVNLGYAYHVAGERDKARASYRRALELKPEDELARDNLMLLQMEEPPQSGGAGAENAGR